jgi:hypothetical protein
MLRATLSNTPRNIIQRILNPRILSQMTPMTWRASSARPNLQEHALHAGTRHEGLRRRRYLRPVRVDGVQRSARRAALQGPTQIARHIIGRRLIRSTMVRTALDDVASDMFKALPRLYHAAPPAPPPCSSRNRLRSHTQGRVLVHSEHFWYWTVRVPVH